MPAERTESRRLSRARRWPVPGLTGRRTRPPRSSGGLVTSRAATARRAAPGPSGKTTAGINRLRPMASEVADQAIIRLALAAAPVEEPVWVCHAYTFLVMGGTPIQHGPARG